MFMKHKLLYLFTLLFMATSVGWGQNNSLKSSSELTFKGTDEDVNLFKTSMGIKEGSWVIIYGNGFPMTIEKTKNASSDNQITVTFNGQQAPDPISLTGEEKAIIFGGSKDVDLDDDTSITLKSGDVGYIIGGGWGTKGRTATNPKTANVKNVSIDIQNGSVGLIYSGGLYRANVGDINLNIKNAVIDHIYCGGFDQGQTSNTIETEWDSSVNQAVTSTLNMDNSTVNGYLFLGGGQGYSYSTEVKATISKSKLRGGILGTGSNGRSNKVVATVSGCTFERITNGDIIEIAPINRGYVKEVEMTFNGCTFPESLDDYKAYLGATYCYDGKSKAEVDKVSLHFANCINTPEMRLSHGLENADVTLTGTKAIVGTTYESSSKTLNAYTVATGKEWNLGGIRYEGEATLTNNGSLSITCPTVDDLVAAVKAKANTITLDAETYLLKSQLQINNKLILKGKGKTETIITADKSWTGGEDTKDLIKVAVVGDNTPATLSLLKNNNNATDAVSLSKLTISGAKGNGLVATTPVSLTDVALTNNAEAGLMVASTTVTATNLTTSDNGECGAKVTKENDTSTSLKIEGDSNLGELKKIMASEDNLVEGKYVNTLSSTEGENGQKIYGVESKLTTEAVKSRTNVYANGTPITIKANPNDPSMIDIFEEKNTSATLTLKGRTTRVFGGAKDKAVSTTSITMESGIINRIYGGGISASDPTSSADVNKTASIVISGGTVTEVVCGGGEGYAKTSNISINISGKSTKIQCLYAGGFANPVATQLVNKWDDAVCGAQNVEITITDATFVEGLGCGGGQGYAYTGKSIVNITGATLGAFYGTLANGYADKITATLKGCTFKPMAASDGKTYYEMGSINRGSVGSISFNFDGCSFEDLNQLNASMGAVDGWADSDTNGKPEPVVTTDLTFTFANSKTENPVLMFGRGLEKANAILDGAKASITSFRDGAAVSGNLTTYQIAEGKTWIFKNGLSIEDGVILTYGTTSTEGSKITNGTLIVGGSLTPAKEEDVTNALISDKAQVTDFDVTGLDEWTSTNLATKLNETFYDESAPNKRTEPFTGITFICKDNVIVCSDKETADKNSSKDAKYLIWDDTDKKYKTGEGSIETKPSILFTITISGGNATDITSVKANDEPLTATDGKYSVYAGQKLIITFQTKDSYSVSAKIGDTDYQNSSEYTVPADVEALEMKITYTYVPDDPSTTDPDPEPTEEVKLSFDTTEKTVKVGDEFTLNVTVTGAESSRIVWTSSNSNVATVTSNGKVKAVGTGKATITARIGDVEAVCTLTVEAQPTGIEAVSAGTKLYTVGGQIVIIPAEPVQVTVHAVTGVCIYTGRISEALYIPASAGIYLVTLSAGEGEATEKVSVR